jgi:hypothetical protein
MTTDAAARVARGAALLDREKPDWAARVNLSRLDLADPSLCVLGQVHGSAAGAFGRAAASLGLQTRLADHGFALAAGLWWSDLHPEWVAAVEARRPP